MEKTEPQNLSCKDIMIPRSLWPEIPLHPNLLYIERMHGPRAGEASFHEFVEMICISGGSGLVCTATEKIEVAAGDCFLIPPYAVHYEVGSKQFDTIWIGFYLDRAAGVPSEITCVNDTRLTEMITEAWRCTRAAKRLSGPELDGQLLVILGYFLRLYHIHPEQKPSVNWDAVLDHMRDNFSEPLDISKLTAMSKCSESYFFRHFRELTGCTPLQYITELRISQVKVYLSRSTLTLAEIAKICGFNDPYYFSRCFKSHVGLSPSEYRRQFTGKHR